MNPPDFFLLGYLQDKVYVKRPQSIQALKANISNEISQIPREIQNVMQNFKRRLQMCLERYGGHLEHVIKRRDD